MKLNKNILRIALVVSYIILIAFLVFGVSSLFSYLNTGADRGKILHVELKKVDQYLPKVSWTLMSNEGRFMDKQTLTSIENDYLDAWYVKQNAYRTNIDNGVEDYYTDKAKQNILNFINHNKKTSINVDGTTLEHHLTVEFFSEDGQLVVLTDSNVHEYRRVFENKKLILETNEISDYKFILLLEDGFWRVRHLVKENSKEFIEAKQSISKNLDIKGINYYPQKTPWDTFGDNFNSKILNKDFNLLKDEGINTIRVFIPYTDFGEAKVDQGKLEKLKILFDTAEINEIKVMPTLFDFYGDYSVINWTLNHRHAETIVSKFKDHEALLGWDIKNEPDLDFESRGQSNVLAWLKNMIYLVKKIDDKHPVTIGWSNAKSAVLLNQQVDFVSFHYYNDINEFNKTFKNLKQKSNKKQVVLSEFGVSSYRGFWNPFGHSEKNQAEYYKEMQNNFKLQNISFLSWTLYDFETIPTEVVGKLPWRKVPQKYFGFLDGKGNKKEAFRFISKSK